MLGGQQRPRTVTSPPPAEPPDSPEGRSQMREPRSKQSSDGNHRLGGKLSPPAQSGHSRDAAECRGHPGSTRSNSRCRDPDRGTRTGSSSCRGPGPPDLTHSRSRDRSADQVVGAGPAGKCSPRRPVGVGGGLRLHAVASTCLRLTLPVPSGREKASRSETKVAQRSEPK